MIVINKDVSVRPIFSTPIFHIKGKEEEALNIYRLIYDQGVEPKVFINDFLEILYYFKNIQSLKVDGTNFSLNDSELHSIKEIAKNIDNEILILFWQFTIKTLEELDIVSNQNLSIEMFLIRLVHLKDLSNMHVLSIELFPNGRNYFDRKICDINKIYIIHNNWIAGIDNKVKRFKDNGLWYI